MFDYWFQDVKQQDHIARLETTIENLTSVVSSVERSIESMHQQVFSSYLQLIHTSHCIYTKSVMNEYVHSFFCSSNNFSHIFDLFG